MSSSICWCVRAGFRKPGPLRSSRMASLPLSSIAPSATTWSSTICPSDELRINCCDAAETSVFPTLFRPLPLWGRSITSPGASLYTLDPLVQGRDGKASVVCDVPGMEEAVLKAVEITHNTQLKHLEHHEAEDVLELVEQSVIAWPKEGRITKATFEIRFRGSCKTRRVTVCASNKLLLARDADAPIVHEWLQRRSFTKVEVGI